MLLVGLRSRNDLDSVSFRHYISPVTPENDALIRDAKALVRESLHVKRAAGWADVALQLCTALERSETVRDSLEVKVQELTAQLARGQVPRARAHPLPYLDEDY